MTAPTPPQGPAQGGPQGPQHFTPPPAEPVSQSSARKNLVIAGVLAGGGWATALAARRETRPEVTVDAVDDSY